MTRILVGTEKNLVELGAAEPLFDSPNAIARGAGGWWAVADDSRVLTSSDARSWRETARIRGLRANCVLPYDGGALVGTSEAHIVRVADAKTARVRSFDRVPTRGDWYTPWGGPADVRSMSMGPDGACYANVHVGGILRSDDGEHWEATAMDVDADVHQVLAHPRTDGLVFAATAIGLATSRDGGASWAFEDEGLHAAYCRAVAIAGSTLLLSASTSHTGRKSALYRRPVAGGEFERCTKGFPEWFADNVDTHCLDASGDRCALDTSDGRVFVSDDAGVTWDEGATGLPTVTCIALA